ncbi:ATP-dependent DNA helicase RecG [Parcubacteria bacterium DG_74_2]|nr:MAG: ATP-dependent DNA helicase RecG [Parcubacteria bacterium DG_74_2]
MTITLSTSIKEIPRIGPVYVKKLEKMGIKTVQDILYHFPHRYEDFSNLVPISKVKLNQTCCIQGKILEIKNTRTWKKRMFLTQAIVEDKTGAIRAVWFNQPYLTRTLKPGDNVCLAGKVALDNSGAYLSNPAYEKTFVRSLAPYNLTHVGRLVPVYPETEKLSSRWLRYILKPLLLEFRNKIADPLPKEIIKQENLLPLNNALWQIHFPDSMALAKKAQERFTFEELFLIELAVLKERLKLNQKIAASIPMDIKILKRFTKSLPFKLTDDQKKSAWQILKDLEKSMPMNRLLEGDVGSGKTVVAVMAVLNTVKAGCQATIMAPTEILAKQHFKEISSLLHPFKISVALLTGKEDKLASKKLKNETIEISRKKLLENVKNGKIDILIGTHALISPSTSRTSSFFYKDLEEFGFKPKKTKKQGVKFKNLGLVIIDEQHRFGIEQRAKLVAHETKVEAPIPHLLSMTATPIPRTLALTIYGDLDLSLINELPKGRKKIITKIVAPADRQKAYNFIKKEVKKDKRVFVICPRIEKSETQNNKITGWSEVKAVKQEYEKLSKEIFPKLKVGMLHGKIKSKEKEKIMRDFKIGKIEILVSTSVIEVGIDIPEATVMLIEGADRFGLAQLHQFRGRVGRSKYQSYCFLFTDSPSKKTRQRLKALVKCESGFDLSEQDLKIRGPGEIYGVRQWGIPDLAMDALKNLPLVEKTRESVKQLLEQDPELKKFLLLRERLKGFREKIHLE